MSWRELFCEWFVYPLWHGFAAKASDAPAKKVAVKEWRLDKFEGNPPQPGDPKLPIEFITGGDGLPTRRFVRAQRDGFYHWTEAPLES